MRNIRNMLLIVKFNFEDLSIFTLLFFLVHWTLMVLFGIRVIMRRRPVGVSLSWLSIMFLLPYIGILLYLLIGEVRLGERRALKTSHILKPFTDWLRSLKPRVPAEIDTLPPVARLLVQQAYSTTGFPALTGNQTELLRDAEESFHSLIRDINESKNCCNLQFYIFQPGGMVDELTKALIGAAARGAECRLLVDSIGSSAFLKSGEPLRLRGLGIKVVEALHANFFHALLWRQDVRNHRKIVTIDERIAYTGSMNMADPLYFKTNMGVGHWVDALVRIEGPAVESLEGVFLGDWQIEAGTRPSVSEYGLQTEIQNCGKHVIQTIPSGPDQNHNVIHDMMLSAIYAATKELVITTPYFVPGEEMLTALCTAGRRGVNVILILPKENDSKLVFYASRSNYDDLLDAGVKIAEFNGGLLHTKSVLVDGEFCLFGSVNLDQRSFWINFEVTLLIFDQQFATKIATLQESYLQKSTFIDLAVWRKRPFRHRLLDNTVRLLGPLL